MKVLEFPLARITLSFVSGVLFAFLLTPNSILIGSILLTSLLALFFVTLSEKKSGKENVMSAVLIYCIAFFVGANTLIAHTESYQKSNYVNNSSIFNDPHDIEIIIREKIKSSKYHERYIALVSKINDKKSSGKIILNISKKATNRILETGNYLQISAQLQKNKPPTNPNQFDYGNYLDKKQLYAQLYTDEASIAVSTLIKKDIWYYSAKIKATIIRNLEHNHFSTKELNVAVALLMGQRQDIAPELIQSYQYAGAIHILSVSGLHVGFIILFLNFVLKPIPNTKKGSFTKLIITLIVLWLFGVIAGLSPSVLRSVTMFSFVAVGYNLRRTVNIYHTLLVSIFVILLFQPYFLFDVGFQLSYIALFSIIWLQPLLKSIRTPRYKFTTSVWNILTVSIAAQIGTLPLTIYYFHQFPGLFFITNLAIIPLLSVIMFLGIIVLLLAGFGYVPLLLSKPLEWSIFLLNSIVNTIASFEQFIIKDIPLNFYVLLTLYLVIVSTIVWLKKPSYHKLVFALLAIIMLQSSKLYSTYKTETEREWIVFNAKRNSLITERNGKTIALFANDSIVKNPTNNQTLKSYLVANASTINHHESLKNLSYFKLNKISILDSTGIYPPNLRADIIVITQSPKLNLDRLLQSIKPKQVIADASNYKSFVQDWKKSCLKEKIPFHATAEKGFYKLN